MSEEVKPNLQEATTLEAQLVAENIKTGKEKAPKVDFEQDYKAAQQYSVSDAQAKSTGNPDNYTQMAKDIADSRNESVENKPKN